VLGLVRARRGVEGAWPFLDEAADLARGADELQRLIPTAAARAEVCLLEGREEDVAAETDEVLAKVRRLQASADAAVILGLRRRAGLPPDGPIPGLRSPWVLELDGRAGEAADVWGELGLPYERAWCLVMSNDEDLARSGLVELQALGAEGAVTAARRILRRRGVRGLARGPRAATARTAHGLTPRQLEVLGFLMRGLRNAEIADRMVVSERTVDHHVSAVLQKLGVQSRTQAVMEAERQGLVPVE
jgi:DNA-binding CsgD family transcriptional regulator